MPPMKIDVNRERNVSMTDSKLFGWSGELSELADGGHDFSSQSANFVTRSVLVIDEAISSQEA